MISFVLIHGGGAETYDLIVDSSRLGIDRSVDLLEQYIYIRKGLRKNQ